MSIIFLDKVTKVYGKNDSTTTALNNVSLVINRGESVAIMGPSGSGKSTLLSIIGCVDDLTTGNYSLNEKSISTFNQNDICLIRNKTFGFIFQQFALFSEYTALENIEMPLVYRSTLVKRSEKLSSKKIKEKALVLLSDLGLADHKNKRPSELSGGQQQRVAIARALISDPDIIIADEPTGALDQKNGEEILKLLMDSNAKGKTVIIVTHDEKVAGYCKRRIKLVDGKVVDDIIQEK